MEFISTPIEGLVVIKPQVFTDCRGYFLESFNEREFHAHGIKTHFVQDNISCSSYGVVRGLHCQTGEFSQAKLVSSIIGRVLDVAVDIRHNSKTFGQHYAVELSEENHLQLYIPRGFLHGFSVLSPTSIFSYKVDNFYNKDSEWGMRYDAPEFNIDWKLPLTSIITSEKDRIEHALKDVPFFS